MFILEILKSLNNNIQDIESWAGVAFYFISIVASIKYLIPYFKEREETRTMAENSINKKRGLAKKYVTKYLVNSVYNWARKDERLGAIVYSQEFREEFDQDFLIWEQIMSFINHMHNRIYFEKLNEPDKDGNMCGKFKEENVQRLKSAIDEGIFDNLLSVLPSQHYIEQLQIEKLQIELVSMKKIAEKTRECLEERKKKLDEISNIFQERQDILEKSIEKNRITITKVSEVVKEHREDVQKFENDKQECTKTLQRIENRIENEIIKGLEKLTLKLDKID